MSAILTIFNDSERSGVEDLFKQELDKRVNKKGRFSNAVFEVYENNGFDKVFIKTSIKSKWSVIKNIESSLKKSIWVAECSSENIRNSVSCVSSWLNSNFFITITGDESYLSAYGEIRGTIDKMIFDWSQ